MDKESNEVKIVTDDNESVSLYSLFSNPVKDLFVFIGLFLIGYFVITVFTIKPNIPQFVSVARKNVLQIHVDKLKSGNKPYIESWEGVPIGIYKRTNTEIESLIKQNIYINDPFSRDQKLPAWWRENTFVKKGIVDLHADWLHSNFRSIKDEYFIFIFTSVPLTFKTLSFDLDLMFLL